MITKSVKLIKQRPGPNRAAKLSICVPDKLSEVTLGQMIELTEATGLTDLKAISILSGIPLPELQNVKDMAELHMFETAVLSLSHQIAHLYKSDSIPKRVSFYLGHEIKTVNVSGNLSVEPAGAFMAAREIIAEEINAHIHRHGNENWQQTFNPSFKACSLVLAHYFFCRVTGKLYNEYEAEEFCNEIKKLRVTEALPIAKHFFTCYPNLSIPKINYFQQVLRYWKQRLASGLLTNLSISIS